MLDLHVLQLGEDELALAYPLVRSAVRIDPSYWQDFARALIDDGGGVLGVRVDAKCLYGLATYRSMDTLRHGRALSVELLVSIDLGRRQPVRQVLHRRLDEIARARRCRAVVVTLLAGASPQADPNWGKWGFADATSTLVCQLGADKANDRRAARAIPHE